MTNWKYIGFDDPSGFPQVIIFPPTLQHGAMVPRSVVPRSAGFITATTDWEYRDGEVNEYTIKTTFSLSGHSTSLNLHPRPADAEAFAIAQ